MKQKVLKSIYLSFFAIVLFIFISSCVIAVSDAQGALVFIFALPVMATLLGLSWRIGQTLDGTTSNMGKYSKAAMVYASGYGLFFFMAFFPVLNIVPTAIMGGIGKSFELVTGKTPREYFREQKSLPVKLTKWLKDEDRQSIRLADSDLSYAWDRVCVFGPYTNNDKAKEILNLDWKIEERSEIASSDSINALVFLYQGKVNFVVDLKRGIADFKELEVCYDRSSTDFRVTKDGNSRTILEHIQN